MGNYVKSTIINENGTACFRLSNDDRCPHLNSDNLCNIIINLGEDALCDICTDHPRFKNYFSGYTEMGLGMCCEEAARLILNYKDDFELVPFEMDEDFTMTEDEEQAVFLRNGIFELLKDRDESILNRFCKLSKKFGFDFLQLDTAKICNKYLSFERLDDSWTLMLESIKNINISFRVFDRPELETAFSQLACYFIFRHFADGVWDDSFNGRVKFALTACFLVGALLEKDNTYTVKQMEKYARMLSAEVEYSDINMEKAFEI